MSNEEDSEQSGWKAHLESAMHHAYSIGHLHGKNAAGVDRRGGQALAAVCGWAAGVATGLVVTGWLP